MKGLAASFLWFSAASVFAQAGTLDPTFSGDGIATLNVAPNDDYGSFVAMQPDGKILVLGSGYDGNDHDIVLLRYSADGTLDDTFGVNGQVVAEYATGEDDGPTAMAVRPDGKILVAGHVGMFTQRDFALAQFNSDGTLDGDFGTGGVVITDVNQTEHCHAIALQSDGRILIAGATDASSNDFAVLRFHVDGSLDNTFNGTGIRVEPFGPFNDSAQSIAVRPDGKILVGGFVSDDADMDFAVMRFNANGSLDMPFGTGGTATASFNGGADQAWDMAIQPDQKIVLVGTVNIGNFTEIGVVRFEADGDVDVSFDQDGMLVSSIGPYHDRAQAVLVQPDGRILVGGRTRTSVDDDLLLVRYNADGSFDTSFDGDGIVTTGLGTDSWESLASMAFQTDGRLVVVGSTESGPFSEILTARYFTGFENGIAETDAQTAAVRVAPNPATNEAVVEFTMELAGNTYADLFDATGRKVMAVINGQRLAAGTHRQNVDLAALAEGMYTLLLRTPGSSKSVRIVKR